MRMQTQVITVLASTSLGLALMASVPFIMKSDSPEDRLRLHSIENPTSSLASEDLVYVSGIQHLKKKPDFGGEACIAMFLKSLGYDVDQDAVFDASGIDPILGRGCHTTELVLAAKTLGFQTGPVWLAVDDASSLSSIWESILVDLKNKTPSVVCRREKKTEQFVLVIGYAAESDEIIVHNPNRPDGANEKIARNEFLNGCLLNPSSARSSKGKVFVRIRLAATRLKIPNRQTGFTDADFAQHIRKLKTRLPNPDFKMFLQKPFVVIGDGSLEQVKRSAIGTVKWSVDSIKRDYFSKNPNAIIDVWLFKDPQSYKLHNQLLFDTQPSTPFGYFSPANHALVMDISTGGGTLVHEIVHPFMENNFPECPSWFNEGLASLYEQSAERDGHIVGLTNWRLRGLQLTIRDGRLPTFETLCSTTRREFYDGTGSNYAQARYLCYYLQEHGLLVKYYHQFNANVEEDPSGYDTLKQVLGRNNLDAFQKEWEAYVLKLRFRR